MAGNFTPGTGADFHYRGTTDGGAPSTGQFTVGDWVETPTGISVCQLGGSPGTWADLSSASASTAYYTAGAWVKPTGHATPWTWLVGASDPLPAAGDGLLSFDLVVFTAQPVLADVLRLPTIGEDTVPMPMSVSVAIPVSQDLALSYFTAYKTETVTKIRVSGSSTVSSGLTLARLGVWTTDATGALLAQVAATPNDTTLLNTANTPYEKTFTASFVKQAGQRYAVGLLQVGTTAGRPAATAYQGSFFTNGSPTTLDLGPRHSAKITGQADLPSTALASALATFGFQMWARLLP